MYSVPQTSGFHIYWNMPVCNIFYLNVGTLYLWRTDNGLNRQQGYAHSSPRTNFHLMILIHSSASCAELANMKYVLSLVTILRQFCFPSASSATTSKTSSRLTVLIGFFSWVNGNVSTVSRVYFEDINVHSFCWLSMYREHVYPQIKYHIHAHAKRLLFRKNLTTMYRNYCDKK